MSYQNYYGVQLLNDLHNYFPDILYGNRFHNDPLVLYIRQQVANRFNLYTNAQNEYFNNQRNTLQNQQTNRVSSIPQTTLNQTIYNPVSNTTPTATANANTNEHNMDDDSYFNILLTNNTVNPTSSLANVLQSLFAGLNSPLINYDDLQPIVVRPTQQQIDNGSSIIEVTNTQDSCAICQEQMNPNDRIRRLNQCRHMFHNQCIIQSFQTSPRCPVCRHDIRT